MEVQERNLETNTMPNSKLKHPKGLYLLFCTEMWERFSYYGLKAILLMYLTAKIASGGLGFNTATGVTIFSWYAALTYFTPILGGHIADKYLGQKKAIVMGGTIMAIGNLLLFAIQAKWALFIGLFLLVVGNGFFKPNISTVVGQLYEDGDHRRNSAFTIFYMGINLGSFIAPIVCGFLAEDLFATKVGGEIMKYGFKYGFLAASIGMILGQVIFMLLAPKYLSHVGEKTEKTAEKLAEANRPLTKQEKKRTAAILILTAFVIFFWTGFEQAGTSLTLFTKEFTNRSFLGFEVPVSWFQSFNPLFVLLLGPFMAKLWFKLANREKGDVSIPMKMGIGMFVLGAGFLLMVAATISLGDSNAMVKASMWWLVGTYLFNTIGELCLSPIGLSMVSSIAPVKLTALLMGVWLSSNGIANLLGGVIASKFETLGTMEIFGTIAGMCMVLGLILVIFSKKIAKMME